MNTNTFDYFTPGSVAEAIDLLSLHGDQARIMAGGHSLIPAMRLRLAQPKVLVDIGRVGGLNDIRLEQNTICIGALATHYQVESSDLVRKYARALQEAAASIGDPQVRNRGTIGGSSAHADPAADYPAALLALDAELVANGPGGIRIIDAASFFVGPLTTALQKCEILTEIRIPFGPVGAASTYQKLSVRQTDFALVGVAAQVTVDDSGICTSARLALSGVGHCAYRAARVEEALLGLRLSDLPAVTRACEGVVQGVSVNEDAVTSADFRSQMARVYARRVIQAAAERC